MYYIIKIIKRETYYLQRKKAWVKEPNPDCQYGEELALLLMQVLPKSQMLKI